jgi:hypothetical protein
MATCYQSLTVAECNQLLSACKGLKITHVWRSVSPCIFLEIGRLAKVHRHHHPVGQVSVMVEADWRVEKPRSVEVGSGFSSTRIDKRLPTLVSAMVNSIEVTGRLPELAIGLDDGRRFVTSNSRYHRTCEQVHLAATEGEGCSSVSPRTRGQLCSASLI